MAESTINAKGQTTVPASVRRLVKVKTGTRLVWPVLSDGTIIVRPETREIRDLAGMLKTPEGAHVCTDDLSR